jgi:hypothetical protein
VLECPEGLTQPSESSLHLIPNAHNSSFPQSAVNLLVKVLRWDDLSSAAEHVLRDEGSIILIEHLLEMLIVSLYWVFGIFEGASVGARRGCYFGGTRFLVVLAPFVGTDLHRPASNAVISSLETDHSSSLGMHLRHLKSKVIGLRTSIDKGNAAELLRQSLEQLTGGSHELIIQKPRVGEQSCVLGVHLHDVVWMAVSYVRNVVDTVQHLIPIFLVEILSLGVEQLEGLISIGKSHHGVHTFVPLLNNAGNLLFIL